MRNRTRRFPQATTTGSLVQLAAALVWLPMAWIIARTLGQLADDAGMVAVLPAALPLVRSDSDELFLPDLQHTLHDHAAAPPLPRLRHLEL